VIGHAAVVQQGDCHASGFLRGFVATGQGQRAQVAQAFTAGAIYQQHVTAPCGVVRAQPHAIERDADHWAIHVVLSQHGGDVGVVVLHGDGGHAQFIRQAQGELGAEEVGVQVVCDGVDGSGGLCQQLLH
jgi:hypothetical protein